jgi:hypothetical protein
MSRTSPASSSSISGSGEDDLGNGNNEHEVETESDDTNEEDNMESGSGSNSNSNDETNTSNERVGYEADDDQGNSSSSNSNSSSRQKQRASNTSAGGTVAATATPSSLNAAVAHKTLKHHSRTNHSLSTSSSNEVSIPEHTELARDCATATTNVEETLEEQHHRRNFKRRRTFSRHRMSSRATETMESSLASLGNGNGGTISSMPWAKEETSGTVKTAAAINMQHQVVVAADAVPIHDWNAVFKLHGNPHRQLLRNYTEAVEDDCGTSCPSKSKTNSNRNNGNADDNGSGSGSGSGGGRHALSSEGFTSFFTTTESGGGSEEHHHQAHRKRSGQNEDSSPEASSCSDGAPGDSGAKNGGQDREPMVPSTSAAACTSALSPI